MEHYITFHKIVDLIQDYQEQSPRLKSFGYGDVVYFMNNVSGTTTQYPFLFLTPLNITYNENTTQYQMSLIFADIVNTDLTNEKDVVSDMSLEARRFLSYIKRGDLMDVFDTDLPTNAIPFFEKFNDHVGGVVLDLFITVFEDINACDPFEPVSPTPSITPSITPSPTP
jgi:hypothetical protein